MLPLNIAYSSSAQETIQVDNGEAEVAIGTMTKRPVHHKRKVKKIKREHLRIKTTTNEAVLLQ